MENFLAQYKKIAREMIKIVVYVEGNNKLFYQNLIELKDYFVEGVDINFELQGGNCSSVVRKKVSDDRAMQRRSVGIIDRDYNVSSFPGIYSINYYSIENLGLIEMDEFNELRNNLKGMTKDNLHEVKKLKLRFEAKRNNDKRLTGFNVKVSESSEHIDFNEYIDSYINCFNSFLRYKNLKVIIEKYFNYYKPELFTKTQKSPRKVDSSAFLGDSRFHFLNEKRIHFCYG